MKRKANILLSLVLAVTIVAGMIAVMPTTVKAHDMGKAGYLPTVSAGSYHTAVIKEDGSLLTWGANNSGALGDSTTKDKYSPVSVLENATSVTAGFAYTAAITKDGILWTWGNNHNGRLGDGTTTDRHSPVKVMENVVAVSTGNNYAAAITEDGVLWTWNGGSLTPVKVMESVVAVSAGDNHMAAITRDGVLWTWGSNMYGQLGDGTTQHGFTPVKVLENVTSVSAGFAYTAAITEDGALWTWGRNLYGCLGDGTTTNRLTPVKVLENVVAVSVGAEYIVAITEDGALWTWGDNSHGQLGNGTQTNSTIPVKVLENVAAVSAGWGHTAAIIEDGTLWTWGHNPDGRLGDGTTTDRHSPVKVLENVMLPGSGTGTGGGTDVEPIVDLDALMGTDPKQYCNELAEVAARLSLKTYDNDCTNDESVRGYLTYNLGFNDANIHSGNYGGDYAFTIATKEYNGDDADEILVIVAQGTTTIGEAIKDYISKLDYDNARFYGGYAPYQVVSAFYSEIVTHEYGNSTNLYSLTKQDKRYKILVTGHSLGGAVANLLAAQLTARRHIGGAIGQSDVFCYTFGAIDSIRVDSPIVEGYENIHNIYNELDTLSPTQYGRSIIGKNGIFLRNGKFGVIEPFEHEYRTPEEKSNGNQLLAAVNHKMSNYLEAVKSNRVQNSTLRPANAGALDLINSYSVVGCPVNVDVYCEGELVGRVVNNVVDDTATSINIFVDDDVKFIIYPDNRQYDLKITAFDEGSMVYYTQDLAGEMHVKTISNVTLTDGKKMTSQVGGSIETPDVKLYVVDENDKKVAEIEEDGTEVPVSHKPGDINNSGNVDGVDKAILNRYLAGWEGYKERILNWDAADIDRSGNVDGRDKAILNRYLAGWEGYDEYFTEIISENKSQNS